MNQFLTKVFINLTTKVVYVYIHYIGIRIKILIPYISQ